MTKVLITGGSGSIGTLLANFLTEKGYEVSILGRSRSENTKYKTFLWNYKENFIEKEALADCDYIVHLAGAGIADKRWTDQRKKEILDSRVLTSELLYQTLASGKNNVKAFISASGVGYYGQLTSDKTFTETDPAGSDFVGTICKQWEESVNKFNLLKVRTVNLRIGIVLMKKGGALEKMAQPFRLGLGSALASGKQVIPWIHVKDLNNIILEAICNSSMQGPYNCCSPETTNNLEFSKTLAKTLRKKIWLPNAPAWILRMVLGKRAILLTEGSGVSAQKLLHTGFQFTYPQLEAALSDLLL
jgi:uncharacterized protein (TIGR01777 family)